MKPVILAFVVAPGMSLPVRGRGLKLGHAAYYDVQALSLPVRGRGLKLACRVWVGSIFCRSPCGGVD